MLRKSTHFTLLENVLYMKYINSVLKEHNYLISLSSWQGVLDTTLCDKVRQ